MDSYNDKNIEYYTKMVNARSQGDRVYWRNKIVESNMKLVKWACQNMLNYIKGGLYTYDDLLQEISILLVKAVENWSPDKGTLSTYFYRAVQYHISRISGLNRSLIKIPVLTLNNMNKFRKQYKKDVNVRLESYCECNKLDEKVILSAELCTRYTMKSLDEVAGYDEDGNVVSVEETVSCPGITSIEESLCRKELKELLNQLLDIVCESEEDKKIMWLYGNRYTCVYIGRIFGMEKEDIEKRVSRYLRKLRKPMYASKLMTYLDDIKYQA